MKLPSSVNIVASRHLFGVTIPPRFFAGAGTSGTVGTPPFEMLVLVYSRAFRKGFIRELSTNRCPTIVQARFVSIAAVGTPLVHKRLQNELNFEGGNGSNVERRRKKVRCPARNGPTVLHPFEGCTFRGALTMQIFLRVPRGGEKWSPTRVESMYVCK